METWWCITTTKISNTQRTGAASAAIECLSTAQCVTVVYIWGGKVYA